MGRLQAGIVPVTPFQQNCTILFDADTKGGVVIDPGGDVERIIEAIDGNKLTIREIWLTHGHIDHAGGADELREALEAQAQMFGVPMKVRNLEPDRFLTDGEQVSFDGHVFDVYHCPGHAPGHVIYFHREQRFAHLGDVLFNGSIGRTDLPGGDHATLLRSIRDKVLPLGDDVGFLCGHGPGGRIGEERRSNSFLQGIEA